jgi:NTP pyrophosphatase (non-canonical NTP hydrolase)
MIDDLRKIWDDQRNFNLLFRQPPKDFKEKSQQTRDMVLELTDELHVLLRTMDHKHHRRTKVLPNVAHTEEKLADVFKYFITLCQIHGVSPQRILELYWRKSMVCRQRYSEEWVNTIDRPCVIWDLDQVLCDYVSGVLNWLSDNMIDIKPGRRTSCQELGWVNAKNLGLEEAMWAEIKHDIRTTGAKEGFPVMPGALDIFDWAKNKGWLSIVLTARPIDQYPNLYSDTLAWLKKNNFHADFIWWADDKPERIGDLKKHVVFAVDDMYANIDNYHKSGIKTYWFTQQDPNTYGGWSLDPAFSRPTTIVRSLSEIREHYERTHNA